MGKTSVEVKERYNKKTYEDIRIRVRKGQKAIIQTRADAVGKSINSYMVDLVRNDLSEQGIDLEAAADKENE